MYKIKYKDDYLVHAGKKGMKWGYNDGQRNGRRTAEELLEDLRDGSEEVINGTKTIGYKSSQKVDDAVYRSRLNRNGLLDRYGSTLVKYGLNKIGKGRLDNKLSSAQRNIKRKVNKFVNRVKSDIKNGTVIGEKVNITSEPMYSYTKGKQYRKRKSR